MPQTAPGHILSDELYALIYLKKSMTLRSNQETSHQQGEKVAGGPGRLLSLPTTLGFPRRSRSSSLRSTLHCCFREKRPFPAQNGKGIPRPTVYCHKLQRRVVSIWSDPWVSAEEHQQTKALKALWRRLWIVSGCWQYYHHSYSHEL